MIPKKQEFKFVEWSRDISAQTYDVSKIISMISTRSGGEIRVLDVGGGIGTVAKAIVDSVSNCEVHVVDNSPLAKEAFITDSRVKLFYEDFLTLNQNKSYQFIIFRTVLHHFVSDTETRTRELQSKALAKAKDMLSDDGVIFVTENFYEPLLGIDLTGRLIFELTVMKAFASLFRRLGANTAGEGVRFRSLAGWKILFEENELETQADILKQQWGMPIWQRVPFLCIDRYQALAMLRHKA